MPIATARQNYQLYGNGGPSALNFFSYLDTINQLGGYIPDITISSPPPPSPTRARPPTPPPFSECSNLGGLQRANPLAHSWPAVMRLHVNGQGQHLARCTQHWGNG